MARFLGVDAAISELKTALKEFEMKAVEEMKKAAMIVQFELNKRTPVWSGETVRNYSWGVGSSAPANRKSPITGVDIGITSNLKLGQEPRRPANEAAVMAELSSLKMTKLDSLTVTNNAPISKWDLIDNGAAPSRERSRSPGGVSKLAIQSARRKLKFFR